MIKYLKLADAIKYIEHQIKDTEYFMIEPISFLKEAIKTRKVIPLFSFKGHATITESYRTRFVDVRQTMKVSGYFTVPYSLPEYESSMIGYGVKLDEASITISQAIIYDLEFVDVIQFTAPFQKQGEYIEPNFHDHIQIEKNDLVNLYVHKPFLDNMKVYYASDSSPENRMYDKIEIKTDDLHFELSHLKALFNLDADKIGKPTVIQGEPKTEQQRIAELQSEIADLENQLAQARAELADKPTDEVELNPKTQTAVTRLLNVLFHKAQLDITAHKGTTNSNIVNCSKSLNAKITEKPVSHWIKQVQQLRIDTQDRNN